jgi:hypothetical protein
MNLGGPEYKPQVLTTKPRSLVAENKFWHTLYVAIKELWHTLYVVAKPRSVLLKALFIFSEQKSKLENYH